MAGISELARDTGGHGCIGRWSKADGGPGGDDVGVGEDVLVHQPYPHYHSPILKRLVCLFTSLIACSRTVYEACRQGFFPGTPVSSPPSSVNGSANKIKLQ